MAKVPQLMTTCSARHLSCGHELSAGAEWLLGDQPANGGSRPRRWHSGRDTWIAPFSPLPSDELLSTTSSWQRSIQGKSRSEAVRTPKDASHKRHPISDEKLTEERLIRLPFKTSQLFVSSLLHSLRRFSARPFPCGIIELRCHTVLGHCKEAHLGISTIPK